MRHASATGRCGGRHHGDYGKEANDEACYYSNKSNEAQACYYSNQKGLRLASEGQGAAAGGHAPRDQFEQWHVALDVFE